MALTGRAIKSRELDIKRCVNGTEYSTRLVDYGTDLHHHSSLGYRVDCPLQTYHCLCMEGYNDNKYLLILFRLSHKYYMQNYTLYVRGHGKRDLM